MGIFDFVKKAILPFTTERRHWTQIPFSAPKEEVNYTSMINWLKQTPELIAVFNVIIEDLLSDGYKIKGGRNRVVSAEKFLRKNNFKSRIYELLFDALPTGDGYWLKRKLVDSDIKSKINKICKRAYSKYGMEYKGAIGEGIFDELKSEDEDMLKTREIITVPSNTLKIHYDKHGNVEKFTQRVDGYNETVDFKPEEIAHFKLMPQAGKVYSFTPLASLVTELGILRSIKTVASSEFTSGGSPRMAITLPNANPESPQFKRMKAALEEYKDLTNRGRIMLIGGEGSDIKTTVFESMVLSPEFKELALWVTQIIVALWGIPSSRIPNLASAGIKTAGEGSSDEGYYRKIAHLQDLLEDLINTQILDEFDVELIFNRSYKQDEIREAQAVMFKVDILTKKQTLLSPYGIKMKKEVILNELGLKEDDTEEGSSMEATMQIQNENMPPEAKPGDRQGFVKNNDINKSPDKAKSDQKKQTKQIQKV